MEPPSIECREFWLREPLAAYEAKSLLTSCLPTTRAAGDKNVGDYSTTSARKNCLGNSGRADCTYKARKVSDRVGVDGVGAKSPWPKTEGQATATSWMCRKHSMEFQMKKTKQGK